MAANVHLSKMSCSLARALEIIGDGWTFLIVRDAFLGIERFGEFQSSLGIAKNVLSDRLQQLVNAGVMMREKDGSHPRYYLTDAGMGLLPALAALIQWGDVYRPRDQGPPVLLQDVNGHEIEALKLRTASGSLEPENLRFASGPGCTDRIRLRMVGKLRASESLR